MIDSKSNRFQLDVPHLHGKIDPDLSKFVLTKEKVKIYLQKKTEKKWYKLGKKV